MPVFSEWYDKTQSIIIMRFVGAWTLEEATTANKTCAVLLRHIKGRFDVIADLSQAAYTLPVGSLWYWMQQMQTRDILFPNWGLTVTTGTNPLCLAYFEEGMRQSKVIQAHCRHCKTIEDAVILIMEHRTSA